ncbi:hypothetical protein LSTR_LSTR013289 [Laodelphax striatellus]|uniref:Beta-1,4-mannosyltransferase n=1 Tax=Laodelphax striatellus TaxID=195883 RepID=A0A482X3T6_LAOST|nr:hypothetical protein LSTR_LSTR013289 [Laodelphax striatellus]
MVVVSVVLLGDIGRSPRMQYHVVSLTSEGYNVDFIGFDDSKPIKKILDNERVKIRPMYQCPSFQKHLPRVVGYFFKAVWQALILLMSLVFKRRSDIVLVQSPPAVPTLVVCWLYCRLAGAKFVIDWHNYAHTNMAFTLGSDAHALVRITEWVEATFGRRADSCLCVTKAMKDDLHTRWGVKATVLYDRPFESFQATPVDVKHTLYMKLGKTYKAFTGETTGSDKSATAFTKQDSDGNITLREDRHAILISSTSWTEDEDFGILLSALLDYDQSDDDSLPRLVCVITGKGPLKEFYAGKMAAVEWRRVAVVLPWLEAEDYPLVLGSGDLGVSLHLSTSGLDLPMKVVDMFGCSLPVAAYKFNALHELVDEGKTGMVFETSNQLAEKIKDWFRDFPEAQGKANK